MNTMNNQKKTQIIGLITDFGERGSHYTGAMKSVILKVLPTCRIIDLNHHVEPFSITETSFILYYSLLDFPPQGVIVAVVDPGVGTDRDIVAVKTKSGTIIIGPDNGMFSLIAARNLIEKAFIVKREHFGSVEDILSGQISSTFHGRDIMAPAGAIIVSNPTVLNKFDEKPVETLSTLIKIAEPSIQKDKITATILYVDQFGNLVTNAVETTISEHQEFTDTVYVKFNGKMHPLKIHDTFGDIPENSLGLVRGSSGFLEICANQTSASHMLNRKSTECIDLIFNK